MVAFKKQFVKYSDNITRTKEQNKRVTISGQSLPMSLIVQRYQTGQLFGLSSFETVYDYNNEPDEFETPFFPDPADPLALERAVIFNRELKNETKRLKDDKEKQQRAGGGNPPPAPSPADNNPVLG